MQKVWQDICLDDYAAVFQHVRVGLGCWVWRGRFSKTGYGVLRWRRRTWLAHRLVLVLQGQGVEQVDDFAIHKCGNPKCVSPHHVRWGSAKENTADSMRHGTFCFGEKTGTAKIGHDLAVEIYQRYHQQRATITQLTTLSGLSRSQIYRILRGESWLRATSKLPVKRLEPAERQRLKRNLSDEHVLQVWSLWHHAGHSMARIAAMTGVGRSMVAKIVHRISYLDVTAGMPVLRPLGSRPTRTQLDEAAKQRAVKGVSYAKLLPSDVRDIWLTFHSGASNQDLLAKKFKVCPATINGIVNRKTWRGVTDGLAQGTGLDLRPRKKKA